MNEQKNTTNSSFQPQTTTSLNTSDSPTQAVNTLDDKSSTPSTEQSVFSTKLKVAGWITGIVLTILGSISAAYGLLMAPALLFAGAAAGDDTTFASPFYLIPFGVLAVYLGSALISKLKRHK